MISTDSVMQAMRNVHEKTGQWPSPHGIAGELGTVQIEDVRDALHTLRVTGRAVCRKRGRRRQWMPRGER